MSLKTRIIPVLLLKNGLLVRSELFRVHQIIGNPVNEAKRFNEWDVDELIYLDISRDRWGHDVRREDHRHSIAGNTFDILAEVARTCFMPLTWGGGLRNTADMKRCFALGADKITVNTAAFRTPALLTEASETFGTQAVVLSLDAKRVGPRDYRVVIDNGREQTDVRVEEWAAEAAERGVGEILLQSVDEDGLGRGYDKELISIVSASVSVPVIACSGVGDFSDYAEGVRAGSSAVAAANIWHFRELTDRKGKRALLQAGIEVRMVPNAARRQKRRGIRSLRSVPRPAKGSSSR
jgi:cyclase